MVKGRKNKADHSTDTTEKENPTNALEKEQSKMNDHTTNIKPTSEQLMLAELISKNDQVIDDPEQKEKITLIMAITEKTEDVVVTALYDAEWDTNVAIGILMEGGKNSTEWEETGKGGKKKAHKSQHTESNPIQASNGDLRAGKHEDVWAPLNRKNDSRDVTRQQLPPRMRRGAQGYQSSRGRRSPKSEQEFRNGNYQSTNQSNDQDTREKENRTNRQENTDMPRRGRGQSRSRGGSRYFQRGRGRRNFESSERSNFEEVRPFRHESLDQGERDQMKFEPLEKLTSAEVQPIFESERLKHDDYVVGYSGNIEKWNPSHSNDSGSASDEILDINEKLNSENGFTKTVEHVSSWAEECTESSNVGVKEESSPPGLPPNQKASHYTQTNDSHFGGDLQLRESRSSGYTGEEIINNFRKENNVSKITNEWDTEEYTGSLADTKVFISSVQTMSKDIEHKLGEQSFQMGRNIKTQPHPFGSLRSSYNNTRLPSLPQLDQNNAGQRKSLEPLENKTLYSELPTTENQASKVEVKSSEAPPITQHLPPGFTRNEYNTNSSLNVSSINKMLLGQTQISVQQAQSPFLSQHTMSPSPWQSTSNPMQLPTVEQLHNSLSQQTEPLLVTANSDMARFDPSKNLKTNPTLSSAENKILPKNQENMGAMSEIPSVSTYESSIDLKQISTSSVGRTLTQELQKEETYNRSQFPPPSKIPSSAVEMPGDFSTKLDVQFGNLDLSLVNFNNSDQLGQYAASEIPLPRGQNQYLGARLPNQNGSYGISGAAVKVPNQYMNPTIYNQLGSYAALPNQQSRAQNQYQPPTNQAQSGSYVYQMRPSNGQNSYVNLPSTGQLGSSGAASTPPSRLLNQHIAANSNNPPSTFVHSVARNVPNQYLSPNKDNQPRPHLATNSNNPTGSFVHSVARNVVPNQYLSPSEENQPRNSYGSSAASASNGQNPYVGQVPSGSNSQTQYVGQIPNGYGNWMDAQGGMGYYTMDPTVLNYLQPYGVYNCQN